jgi:hypothetical protein
MANSTGDETMETVEQKPRVYNAADEEIEIIDNAGTEIGAYEEMERQQREDQLRAAALMYACQSGSIQNDSPEQIVARAEVYHGFLTGLVSLPKSGNDG